ETEEVQKILVNTMSPMPICGASPGYMWPTAPPHTSSSRISGGSLLGKGPAPASCRRSRVSCSVRVPRPCSPAPRRGACPTLGARWIQVDEPGASTEADELDLFVDSFNASVEGLDAMFSTHLCFSDYNLFFPAIERMEHCQQYAVGFANYDSRELGTSDEARPGYQVIKKFRDLTYKPALGLGVLDIHSDFIESPELVRDRVLYAV